MVRRMAGATLVVLCGLSIAVHSPAGASPPAGEPAAQTTAASVSDDEAAGFARERDIPLEQARERLSWQAVAPELAEAVAADLGARSGGVWVDVEDGDRVKVAVVGEADPATVAVVSRAADRVGLAAAGYDLVTVRHPLATIEADNEWLGVELTRANEGASATLTAGLRPDLNAVELQTPQRGTLTAAQEALVAEATERLGERLSVGSYAGEPEARTCGVSTYCTTPLRGGVRIVARDIAGCTAGFTAKSKINNEHYVVTAGHCAAASGSAPNWTTKTFGTSSINYIIGSMWNWQWNSGGDMAILRINNPGWWHPRPWVFVTDGPGTTRNERYHISSDQPSVLGMRICTTGSYYGVSSCGYVTQLGVTVTYGGVTVQQLGRASFCGMGGDSGSPMYALHTAYGLQVAGFSQCDSLYQGIRSAEQALNVDILLGSS